MDYADITRQKPPAPRWRTSRISSGTPAIQVPAEIVTATPRTITATASVGIGLSATNASRILGGSGFKLRSVPLRRAIPASIAADRKNEIELSAKKVLIGTIASNPAAPAHPPIESALLLAPMSAFASLTLRR